METIVVKTHVGGDGVLKLELPIGVPDVDCEVVVKVQPRMTREEWLAFVEETAGSLADDPIERGSQGVHEIREELQRF